MSALKSRCGVAGRPARRRWIISGLLLGGALTALAASPALGQDQAGTASPPACPVAQNPIAPPPPADANLPEVEPVICDDEFAREVPPITANDDPELSRPLESVTEFERRMTGQTAVQPGNPATPAQPPLADPELAKPLPPLDQFDVREIEFAQPAPTSEAPELRYAVRVDGLGAADAATEVSLAREFKDLSALDQAKGKAANEAMLSARLTEDSKLLERMLHAEGWYDARVDTRIDRSAAANGQPVTAVLTAVPGERYRLGTITVTANPTVPPGLIQKNLALNPGEPIIADRIQGAEANVAVVLPQQGYPFAQVGQRDVLLDPDTHLGDYTLPVTVGPRSRFGGFRTTGDLAFNVDHVAVLSRFKQGELYDSRKVDDLRQALIATGLFSTVSVEPERTGQAVGDGTEYVTMLVTQDAGPPRTLAASAGYGTGQGFQVEGSWTHRNLFPPEGALIATGQLGTDAQGASLTFRRSNAGKRDRTFQIIAEALHSNYEAFEAFTGRLATRLSYDSTPIWRKTFTWTAGAEVLGTIEDDYDFALGERTKRKFLIGDVSGQVGIDRSDSLLDPTKGFRAQALVQPEAALGGGFHPYFRSQLDGSAYHPFGDGLVVAGRARIGSTFNVAREDLAPSRRFYAGGGGSVRGFGYQQLGPKDPDGRPLGGLSLVEGAAEVRYRFGNYGVAGFIDAGQVYEKSIPDFSGIRAGVGIGARYYTNFGPLRIDVATPLGRKPGESRFTLYVGIGQAF